MFAKFFIKEWREKRLLLALFGFLLLVYAVAGIAARGKFDAIAMSFFAMVFPLSCAFLLGSSAFQGEFKNEAWTYLFSRPIKKGTIWFYKYISLLGLLAVIILLALLVRWLVPGLDQFLKNLGFPLNFDWGKDLLPTLLINFLLPWLVFTISFSLSLVTENSFSVFILSTTLGAGLWLVYRFYLRFLWVTYAYRDAHDTSFAGLTTEPLTLVLVLLVGAGFVLASWRAFSRTDFSQPGKRAQSFIKIVVPLLIASFALGTVVAAGGNVFAAKHEILPYYSARFDGQVYMGTSTGKIIRYDEKLDRVKKARVSLKDSNVDEFSAGGGKLAYITRHTTLFGKRRTELLVANLDGTQERPLVQFYGKDSQFNGWQPWSNPLISADDRQVAFVAMPPGRGREKTTPRLFWMNTDGTGIMGMPLEFFRKGTVMLLSWLEDEKSLVLRLAEKEIHSLTLRIIKLNLDTGASRALETSLSPPMNYDWMPAPSISPSRRFLIVRLRDQAQNKEKVMLLDLASFETKEIGTDVPIWSPAWTRQSDKFAYFNFRSHALWIYTIADGSLQKAWVQPQPDNRVGMSYDWLGDGKRLVVCEVKEKESFITILSGDFAVEKTLKIPDRIMQNNEYGLYIYGLENKVLVTSVQNGAWRLDLKTDEWKKVY